MFEGWSWFLSSVWTAFNCSENHTRLSLFVKDSNPGFKTRSCEPKSFFLLLCRYKPVCVYLNGKLFLRNPRNHVEKQSAHTTSFLSEALRFPHRIVARRYRGRKSSEPIILGNFHGSAAAAHLNCTDVSHACGPIDFPAGWGNCPIQFTRTTQKLRCWLESWFLLPANKPQPVRPLKLLCWIWKSAVGLRSN